MFNHKHEWCLLRFPLQNPTDTIFSKFRSHPCRYTTPWENHPSSGTPRPSASEIQSQNPSESPSPYLPSYDPGLQILGSQSLGIIFPLRKWMVPNTGFCLLWFLPNCEYYFQRLLAGPVWKPCARLFCLLGTKSVQKTWKDSYTFEWKNPTGHDIPIHGCYEQVGISGFLKKLCDFSPQSKWEITTFWRGKKKSSKTLE